jgi:hypothetical protein
MFQNIFAPTPSSGMTRLIRVATSSGMLGISTSSSKAKKLKEARHTSLRSTGLRASTR